MAQDYLFIIPLVAALAIGWMLGRYQVFSRRASESDDQRFSRDYFQGLNHLLSERTDEAIDSFVRALEVNSETIPAHLALARLLRRKGDVERAIQVHQTLLARPGLAHEEFLRIQMALARDYEAIGLLDRAENLLLEVIRDNPQPDLHNEALRLLVRLYEKESEWQRALEAGRKLTGEPRSQAGIALAHYCCELAEQLLERRRAREAMRYLHEAQQLNPDSVRVSLLSARIAMENKEWPAAVKELRRIAEQDRLFVSETITPLEQCYRSMRQLNEFEKYLDQCMVHAPSTTVILARTELIREQRGGEAAGLFITDELKVRPSIRGFNRLIDLHLEYGSPSARESLTVLRGLTGQLEQTKPIYCCSQCGFAGRTLHWHCPSCRRWGTIRPIQGLEGE